MDVFRMQCFVAVAERLNLTRAAEAVGITQPAMSVQMRELEREMGVGLLRRNRGGIELTDAGEVVRDGFIDVLALYDRTLRRAREVSDAGRVLVKTGYHGAFTAYAPLYQGFREEEPGVEATVRIAEWDELADMLLSGELDVAFLERHEIEARPELESRAFIDETFFCLAIHAGHRLAGEPRVTIDQLAGEQILMSGRRSPSMDWMCRQLISNGLSREQIRLVENVEAEIATAASGAGLAAMPRFMAMPGNPTLVWVPVDGIEYSCEVRLAWRRDNVGVPTVRFIEYCGRAGVADAVRGSWLRDPDAVVPS